MQTPAAAGAEPRRRILGPGAETRPPLQLVPSGGSEAFDGLGYWFEILDDWIAYLVAARELDSSTIEEYESYVQRFFRKIWTRDGVLPHTITERQVHDYLRSLPRTSSVKYAVLKACRSYYAWAIPRGVHDNNPFADIRMRRLPKKPAKAHDLEQLTRILVAASFRSERRGWAILLMVETASRVGALANVRPEDTGTEAGQLIHFRVVKNDRPYYDRLTPKGAEAVRELLRIKQEGCHQWQNGTLIGVCKQTLGSWVKQAARDCGLPKDWHKAHTMRATAATHLYSKTKDAKVVQRKLNHARLEDGEPYIMLTDSVMEDAAASSITDGAACAATVPVGSR